MKPLLPIKLLDTPNASQTQYVQRTWNVVAVIENKCVWRLLGELSVRFWLGGTAARPAAFCAAPQYVQKGALASMGLKQVVQEVMVLAFFVGGQITESNWLTAQILMRLAAIV